MTSDVRQGIPPMKNNNSRNFPAARKGSALGIALMFLSVFVILGGAGYKLTRAEMVSSIYQSKKAAAFYIAEAGRQDALQALTENSSWTTGFTNKPFGDGAYTVTIDTTTNPATVTSKGWVSGGSVLGSTVKSTVKVEVTIPSNPTVFNYAAGALAEQWIATHGHGGRGRKNEDDGVVDNSQVTGDLYSGGDIDLNHGSTITGALDAHGDVNVAPTSPTSPGSPGSPGSFPSTFTSSSTVSEADKFAVPVIDTATLKAQAYAGGLCPATSTKDGGEIDKKTINLGPCYWYGALTIKGDSVITLTGTVYIVDPEGKKNGKLKIDDSTVLGKQTIYIEDSLEIIKSVIGSNAANSSPFIYDADTDNAKVTIKENSTVLNTAIYAPYTQLKIDHSTLSGSFISEDFTIKNSVVSLPGTPIYYPGGAGSAISIVPGTWDEAY